MAVPGLGVATGAYQRHLTESAHRYGFWFRCVALGTCCVLGASASGPAAWTLAVVAVSLTLAQLPAVARRLPRRTGPAVDLALALVLGAGQIWLGPAGTGAWLWISANSTRDQDTVWLETVWTT